MTLNITILTKTQIFQSSDFRYSFKDRGPDDRNLKLITLHYPSFDGFISYTGIATEPGDGDSLTMSDRIVTWIAGIKDIRFHETVEVIRSEASKYIDIYALRWNERPKLSIIIAAFVQSKPVIALISNSQDMEKRFEELLPNFKTSWASLRQGEAFKVLTTGAQSAVSPEERVHLSELLQRDACDVEKIRAGLQHVNGMASRSHKSQDSISPDCTVISLDESGGGLQELTQSLSVNSLSVYNGKVWSLRELAHDLNLGEIRLRGASFGTSKPRIKSSFECDRNLVDIGGSGYSVTEIDHMTNAESRALGISSSGTIVGASGYPDNPTNYQYWTWSQTGGIRRLDHWTNNYGAAINSHDDIVLRTILANGDEAPLVITSTSMRALEVFSGMGEVEVTSINADGYVSGAISTNLDNTDGSRQRPAFWDSSGNLHILNELCGGENGRSVYISDEGLVLVWANRGWWGRIPLIWDPSAKTVHSMPHAVIPIYLSSHRKVVGIGQAQDGQQIPVISDDLRSWERIPVNAGFAPSVANDDLYIGGQVFMDNRFAPWLLVPNGRSPILLPTYESHSSVLHGMNNSNWIVGQASKNEEHHVLLWRPPAG
ncbi:hypothetical protein AB0M44_32670 [Streptosporangium subroseum]|uniref:hypothetical protein n=1 Tax=Streptosporangium subroseum TaxID=106412 RepID=UPI0034463241